MAGRTASTGRTASLAGRTAFNLTELNFAENSRFDKPSTPLPIETSSNDYEHIHMISTGYVTESSSSESEKRETVICSYETGISIDDLPPKSDLNMLVRKVPSAEIEAKGQRWSVFQMECKIKEKACKLIIDGGSFTNVISKGLVYALGLSTWRHPQPHYVE